jgi:hypothetical protein
MHPKMVGPIPGKPIPKFRRADAGLGRLRVQMRQVVYEGHRDKLDH